MSFDFLSAERTWIVFSIDFFPIDFSRLLQSGSLVDELFLREITSLGYLGARSLSFETFVVEISFIQEL